MFQWGSWTRIDLRKPNTLPPTNKPLLVYIEGEGKVVAKFIGKSLLEKVKIPTHYLYHNTHKPIKGHKVWWTTLPSDPVEQKKTFIDYTCMEFEEWPEHIQKEVDKSCLYMMGFIWQLYEKQGKWFVKVQHINHLGKALWIKVRTTFKNSEKPTVEEMHFDFYSCTVNEIEKYEMLYLSERNRELLCDIFLRVEKEENDEIPYERWVIKE